MQGFKLIRSNVTSLMLNLIVIKEKSEKQIRREIKRMLSSKRQENKKEKKMNIEIEIPTTKKFNR